MNIDKYGLVGIFDKYSCNGVDYVSFDVRRLANPRFSVAVSRASGELIFWVRTNEFSFTVTSFDCLVYLCAFYNGSVAALNEQLELARYELAEVAA